MNILGQPVSCPILMFMNAKRETVMDSIALTYTDGGRIKNLVGFLTYLVYPQSLNKRMYLQQVHRHFDHNDELF
jgi:hypothetical protein